MLRFKAKDPVLNAIAGELAYLIAPIGLDLRAAHIWSERMQSATTSAGCCQMSFPKEWSLRRREGHKEACAWISP